MAKTKSRKKEIETDQTQAKVEGDSDNREFLHPSHLLLLEVSQRDIENAKLRMATEEQALRNMILEGQLLNIKIEKQKQLLQSLSRAFESEKEKFTSHKKDIWPQYGFKEDEGLGYDSISGKIVR